ncbi:class I SAM-dependent methyltransferase [Pacificimonas sp. ICDLI1SI03]
MKVRDVRHAVLPRFSTEDRSRQDAVVAMRRLLNGRVRPRNVEMYAAEGAPAFATQNGRQPQSPEDIFAAFHLSPSYRRWSAANRAAQEMLWVSVGAPVYADKERMQQATTTALANPTPLGSLQLDADYHPSEEVAAVDIHLQPGGYALDNGPDDAIAGALYESGGNVFSFGQGIGRSDSKAGVVMRLLEQKFDDFRPRRMLDIGCSAGAASAAYADAWPNCEVHAIDIGAGMLRYAHARAESLGVAVHFHQMDAAGMSFADGSFDLIVSHNLLHEIGAEKRRAMLREAHRALRPGGVVIHQDVDIRNQPSDVHRVERDWDTHYNGEVHWSSYAGAQLAEEMAEAGFAADVVVEHDLAAIHGAVRWYAISGRKAA